MWVRIRKAAKALIILVPVVILGGCETGEVSGNYPELTFDHMGAISLNVSRIDVSTRYIPPLKTPNVEHKAPIPPYVALRRWAERHYVAGGLNNVANMVILDASIRESSLATTGGLKGFFTRDQAARYDGRVAVMLEIRDPRGRQLAFVTARAERSATVPEGATITAREDVLFALTEDLVTEVNRRLDIQVRRHFTAYLIGR